MFSLISDGRDCSVVAGLSVTLTFLVTVILSSLVALLVTMFVCVHGRKTKSTPPSANVAYGYIQAQSTPEIDDAYENADL